MPCISYTTIEELDFNKLGNEKKNRNAREALRIMNVSSIESIDALPNGVLKKSNDKIHMVLGDDIQYLIIKREYNKRLKNDQNNLKE